MTMMRRIPWSACRKTSKYCSIQAHVARYSNSKHKATHTPRTVPQKVTSALKSMGSDITLSQSKVYPSIFTTTSIDVDILSSDLVRQGASMKPLFTHGQIQYIPPSAFNYTLPNAQKPEIAFIGRSNVGKSSLIEALTGNKGIVRVSKTPGCTRTINFFSISGQNSVNTVNSTSGKNQGALDAHIAYLVDMPGYGFAKAGKEEQQRWLEVLHTYLSSRNQKVLR